MIRVKFVYPLFQSVAFQYYTIQLFCKSPTQGIQLLFGCTWSIQKGNQISVVLLGENGSVRCFCESLQFFEITRSF